MAFDKSVKVGVGVWVFNSRNKLLLGLRESKHSQGIWAPPGGQLEYLESIQQCAVRELKEETALVIKPEKVKILGFTNDIFSEENRHYLTVHCRVDIKTEIPIVMEPNKCKEWRWFDTGCLPDNLFLPVVNFFKSRQKMG